MSGNSFDDATCKSPLDHRQNAPTAQALLDIYVTSHNSIAQEDENSRNKAAPTNPLMISVEEFSPAL